MTVIVYDRDGGWTRQYDIDVIKQAPGWIHLYREGKRVVVLCAGVVKLEVWG